MPPSPHSPQPPLPHFPPAAAPWPRGATLGPPTTLGPPAGLPHLLAPRRARPATQPPRARLRGGGQGGATLPREERPHMSSSPEAAGGQGTHRTGLHQGPHAWVLASARRPPLQSDVTSPLWVSEPSLNQEGLGQKHPGGRPPPPWTLRGAALEGGPREHAQESLRHVAHPGISSQG